MAHDAPYIVQRHPAPPGLGIARAGRSAPPPPFDWVRVGAWAGAVVVSLGAWAGIAIAILSLTG